MIRYAGPTPVTVVQPSSLNGPGGPVDLARLNVALPFEVGFVRQRRSFITLPAAAYTLAFPSGQFDGPSLVFEGVRKVLLVARDVPGETDPTFLARADLSDSSKEILQLYGGPPAGVRTRSILFTIEQSGSELLSFTLTISSDISVTAIRAAYRNE